ncbi:hypothetical protein [Aurantiacibacter hainanensis]|uniref:hypothetical protein n=1 Tax=Aurantiacibacter hainanensis TaxID=3076114 RepID=UPI0030C668DB
MMTYLVVGATGLMLLLLVPESKIRWQRVSSKGGAAMLFGLGLFGSVYSLMAP